MRQPNLYNTEVSVGSFIFTQYEKEINKIIEIYKDDKEAQKFIDFVDDNFLYGNTVVIKDINTRELIGILTFVDDENDIELGIYIVPSMRGRGYASRSLRSFAIYFREFNDEFKVIIKKENIKSMSAFDRFLKNEKYSPKEDKKWFSTSIVPPRKLQFVRLYGKIYRYAILTDRSHHYLFEYNGTRWIESNKSLEYILDPKQGQLQDYKKGFENHDVLAKQFVEDIWWSL